MNRKKRKRIILERDDCSKISVVEKIPRCYMKQKIEDDSWLSSTSKDAHDYNMQHRKRGKAIIFNHYFCQGHENPRKGTELDVSRLAETLTSILNFEVRIYNDLQYREIMQVLLKLSKNQFNQDDCLVVFVLTHGTKANLTAADQKYPIEDLWRNFTPTKCPSLAGKPKLFFINACRGKKIDEGYLYRSFRDKATKTEVEADYTLFRAPLFSDFLAFYSTMEGYTTTREPYQGSWFIQSLCDVLENKKYRRLELKEILTLTTRKTALICNNQHRGRITQIPTMMSTLLRNVYFFGKCSGP